MAIHFMNIRTGEVTAVADHVKVENGQVVPDYQTQFLTDVLGIEPDSVEDPADRCKYPDDESCHFCPDCPVQS